ncbi:hypothetical protein EXIGLDRAFT_766334 [Exidia glandulosa HHB12029]|uniref:Uncharacterized protein n=1 Tax=Exidia glandulosa HHB12029 TaxID=1314781 RepID=A0A165JTV5_EXIGL|nr:hypothetical protein EXIGLDRAFT_766334 [Exidia glandulosa HHB12029]
MSDNGQNSQQPLAPLGGNSGSSAPPGPLHQSGSGNPAAKPAPADPQSGPDSGASKAGGPNPKPAAGDIDPAKQQALDRACVNVCTSVVQAYRTGTIDKRLATHKITIAIYRTGRADPKHSDPWIKQLDDHDAACASAAASGQGADPPATGGAPGGDKVASADPAARKRQREDGHDSDGDNDNSDDDADSNRNKRRAYDPGAAAFRKAFFNTGPVSPHVQKTLNARDNYTADIKQARRDVLRGGQCPPFPSELLDGVLSDNAIDFNKIFSAR